MFVYASKTFRSSLTLTRVVDVACEKCSCAYCYQLVRRGTGAASAPYYVGQDAAKERAQKAAMKSAQKKLVTGVEPVACPDCGWIQQAMVGELRRRRGRWLIGVAIAAPIVLAIITLFVSSTYTHGFRDSMSDWNSDTIMVVGAWVLASLAAPAGALGLLWMLRKNVNPNHAYPVRPDIIPGAPMAARRAADGTVEFDAEFVPENSDDPNQLSYQRRDPDVLPGGWVTVQLLNVAFPKVCSRCLKPTELARAFQHGGNELVKVRLPVCDPCYKASRAGRWWWLLIGTVIGMLPGAIWLCTAGPRDQDGAIVLLIVFTLVGALIGWVASATLLKPARFRGYSSERNTIQVRFKNPGFTDDFRAANRAAAVSAVARIAGKRPPIGNAGR